MPTLETADGKPVDVTPVDAEAVNAAFSAAMNDDGSDEQALPKRQPKPDVEPEQPKRRGRPPKSEQSRTVAKAAVTLDDGQRHQGAKGLAQIGAGIAMMLGKATKNQAWEADAVTIASAADELATACVDVARADPAFAARLDKVCSVGPYGALISVGVGLVAQLARNHRPAMAIPGTVHPDELLASASQPSVPAVPAAA